MASLSPAFTQQNLSLSRFWRLTIVYILSITYFLYKSSSIFLFIPPDFYHFICISRIHERSLISLLLKNNQILRLYRTTARKLLPKLWLLPRLFSGKFNIWHWARLFLFFVFFLIFVYCTQTQEEIEKHQLFSHFLVISGFSYGVLFIIWKWWSLVFFHEIVYTLD